MQKKAVIPLPRKCELNLSGYGISKYRTRELEAFCMQYEEKKREIKELYTNSKVSPDVAVQGGDVGKPTEQKAIRAMQLKTDISMIETCLELACDGSEVLVEKLRLNVTRHWGIERLGYIPCGKNQFYRIRAKFFVLLNKMKMGNLG